MVITDGDERITFLRSQSGASDETRREAESLLAIASWQSPPVEPADGGGSAAGSRGGGLDIPPEVDGYRILRPIGEGGMGRVFLARDVAREQDVALKILRPSLFSAESHRRFDKEVRIHQQLHHPGIVKFLSAGVMHHPLGNLCYLATEHVDGRSIREHVRSQKLSFPEILELMADVCDAAHHAHGRGIIHRDLKPSNILVDGSGKPKILDFGLACTLDPARQNASHATASGVLIGTLRYMSPEQARADSPLIGPRSDLYSIGVITFELLADRLPYPIRGEETFARMIAAILTAEPEPLSTACQKPEAVALDPVLARAMAREPEDRYLTCSDLAEDLRRVARGKEPHAKPAPTSQPQEAAALAELRPSQLDVPVPSPGMRSGRASRRLQSLLPSFRRISSLILATLLLIAAVIGAQVIQRERSAKADEMLNSAYVNLAQAEHNIHRSTPTDSTLRAAIELLGETRKTLSALPQDQMIGHLLRHTTFRLGECHWFLGAPADDVEELMLARSAWGETSGMPFDLQIGEKVPSTLLSYASIVTGGRHNPNSANGMVSKRLADFECPAFHLRNGLARHLEALTFVSGPVRENYPAAAESINVIADRGLVLNELGSTLCKLGWVSDSLHLVNEGMHEFADAEHVPDFSNYREPYASFLANYGQGYFIRGELTSNVSDVDSALVRYQQSIWFQDARRGTGSIATRQAVVAAHLLAASLRQGKERNEHLHEARTKLSSLRPEIDQARPLTRVEQGILEARLLQQEAEGLVGSGSNGNSEDLPAEALVDEASRALMRADEALEQVPYPTPTARVLYEKARLAVFRSELAPSEASKAAAEQAIEAARRAIGVLDYPAHHRRLRELSARLVG